MTTTVTTKKITLATVRSFIKKNSENLFINVKSSFDGMTDCCESRNDGFTKAIATDEHREHQLGVSGAWFVGCSRDYFDAYEDATFTGIKVFNSCGSFILAIKK
jgi:hypothetical protein